MLTKSAPPLHDSSISVREVSMYPQGNVYKFTQLDVEYYIEKGIKSRDITEKEKKKKLMYIREFLEILPRIDSEYFLSINEIETYLNMLTSWKARTAIKRIRQIKNFLHSFNPPIQEFDDLIDRKIKELSKAINAETRLNVITVVKDDVNEFLRRLEQLYNKGKITEYRYYKTVSFVLLNIATGRRKEEISRINLSWLNIKEEYLELPLNQTKEGKLLKISDGYKRIPLTAETTAWLKLFLKKYEKEIQEKMDGYMFSSPQRKDGNPTFTNKLMKEFRKELQFKLKTSNALFEIKHLRKFFSQEWERRRGNLYVKLEIMGHSPKNINYLHYSRLSWEDIQKEYHRVYYNISVLTPNQRKLIAKYLPRKRKRRKKSK